MREPNLGICNWEAEKGNIRPCTLQMVCYGQPLGVFYASTPNVSSQKVLGPHVYWLARNSYCYAVREANLGICNWEAEKGNIRPCTLQMVCYGQPICVYYASTLSLSSQKVLGPHVYWLARNSYCYAVREPNLGICNWEAEKGNIRPCTFQMVCYGQPIGVYYASTPSLSPQKVLGPHVYWLARNSYCYAVREANLGICNWEAEKGNIRPCTLQMVCYGQPIGVYYASTLSLSP